MNFSSLGMSILPRSLEMRWHGGPAVNPETPYLGMKLASDQVS